MPKTKRKISLEEIRGILGGLSMAQAMHPRDRYIGGSPEESRAQYWKQDPEMRIITDSIANEYDISSDLLRARLDAEGFTDSRINAINANLRNPKQLNAQYGAAYSNSRAVPTDATDYYGVDDMGTYIKNGAAKLINERWNEGEFVNRKGRTTKVAYGNKQKDNIGIMAASLKMFRDKAKADFPYLTDDDLDRYASAYYNRGSAGGKRWALDGAKGYTIKRSLTSRRK